MLSSVGEVQPFVERVYERAEILISEHEVPCHYLRQSLPKCAREVRRLGGGLGEY